MQQTTSTTSAGARTQLFRMETEHPLAGRTEQHTLKEWKRIYGYDGTHFPFPAKFVPVIQLRVWWIPQVPMKAFTVEVRTVREAKLLLSALGDYDRFQFENNIKPDYCNAGGLSYFDHEENDWLDWEDEDGNDIDSTTID